MFSPTPSTSATFVIRPTRYGTPNTIPQRKYLKQSLYRAQRRSLRRFTPSIWGRSSVGRATRSQRVGQGFDSPRLHQQFNTWVWSMGVADCTCNAVVIGFDSQQIHQALCGDKHRALTRLITSCQLAKWVRFPTPASNIECSDQVAVWFFYGQRFATLGARHHA
jgi:hypothetical protein